eukprot:5933802-Pleurochrysis_carterae.AAC.1
MRTKKRPLPRAATRALPPLLANQRCKRPRTPWAVLAVCRISRSGAPASAVAGSGTASAAPRRLSARAQAPGSCKACLPRARACRCLASPWADLASARAEHARETVRPSRA